MTKEEKYIVFYTTIKSGMWPKIKGDKIPKGWSYDGFEGVLPGVLNDKYNTEAWFYGPKNNSKNNSKKMKEYLKWLYTNYKNKGYISNFTIRKHYPKKK